MKDELKTLLLCSGTLARRWKELTPEMELEWNPLDEESLLEAVYQWTDYFSDNVFPILQAGDWLEVSDVQEQLNVIHPDVWGFAPYAASLKDFEPGDTRRVFLAIQIVGEGSRHEDKETAAQELAQLGWHEPVKLETLAEGLDAMLHSGAFPDEEEAEFWRGCLAAMRYMTQSTGCSFLDTPYEEMYSGYFERMMWEDKESVQWLIADWLAGEPTHKRLNRFNEISKKPEMRQRVVALLLRLAEELK